MQLPFWVHWFAVISLCLSVLSALIIAGDIVAGRRQHMAIMNVVWPLTALYFGPLGLWIYFALGRADLNSSQHKQGNRMGHDESMPRDGHASQDRHTEHGGEHMGHEPKKPFWRTTFVGTTHCGAGCTLGDFVGEWAVFLFGWTLAGTALWASYLADFIFAFVFGIIFQYFAIVPMRHLSPLQGIWAALKADTLSITAFEIGMFGWMAFSRFVLIGHKTPPTHAVYWFSMQMAMIIGFATSYPMNWWLIKCGWKEAM